MIIFETATGMKFGFVAFGLCCQGGEAAPSTSCMYGRRQLQYSTVHDDGEFIIQAL